MKAGHTMVDGTLHLRALNMACWASHKWRESEVSDHNATPKRKTNNPSSRSPPSHATIPQRGRLSFHILTLPSRGHQFPRVLEEEHPQSGRCPRVTMSLRTPSSPFLGFPFRDGVFFFLFFFLVSFFWPTPPPLHSRKGSDPNKHLPLPGGF